MEPVKYFKALSDNTRLRLFNILLYHELNVNEIVALMKMGQSRISRHLKILTDCDLLSSRRDGLWVFYSAITNNINIRFINSIKELIKDNNELMSDLLSAENILREREIKTKRFFDSIAGDWDRLKKDIFGEFDLNAHILNTVDRCKIAVDLGCGTGYLISALMERADTVIGVDNSPRMLEIARKRFANDIGIVDLRLGELDHLPLKDEEADLAIVNMVLHHLSFPYKGIIEAHRILKSGKIFIIIDFDKHSNELMRNRYGDRWLGFKKEEIECWLFDSGFELIKTQKFDLIDELKVNLFCSLKN